MSSRRIKNDGDADSPLHVDREKNHLVIRIGIDRLNGHDDHDRIPELIIEDQSIWVKDIIRELIKEDEIGTTLISELLDTAILNAIDNGSTGLSETSPTKFGRCSKCEDDLVPLIYRFYGYVCKKCFKEK